MCFRVGTAPISIGHLHVSFVSVWVFGTTPISIDHFSSQFEFSRLHLYRSVIHLVSSVRVWDHTYNDRSFSLSVWLVWVFGTTPISIGPSSYQSSLSFSGPHLYQLVIVVSVWVFGAAPISIVIFLSVCVQFESGPHLYWSVIHLVSHLSYQFEFLRLHLYRSVIVMSIWVFGAASISIDHLSISLCSVRVRTTPDRYVIHLVSHLSCQFEFFLGRTYIDQSFSCKFEFLGPHLYWSVIHLVSSVWVFRDRTYIDRSFVLSVWVCVFGTAPISIDHFPCQFEFLRSHLYRLAIFLPVWVCVF